MGLVFDIFGCKRSNKVVYSVSYSIYDIYSIWYTIHLFAVHLVTLPVGSPDYENLHIALTRNLKIFMRAQLWAAAPGVKRRMVSVFPWKTKLKGGMSFYLSYARCGMFVHQSLEYIFMQSNNHHEE